MHIHSCVFAVLRLEDIMSFLKIDDMAYQREAEKNRSKNFCNELSIKF